jgi:hypothetical protein
MSNTSPYFKELDGNTLFTAAYAWLNEDATGVQTLRNAVGTWLWSDVASVQTMDDADFEEMTGPRCVVFACGGAIYLRAEYQTVLTAWRRYRLKYGNQQLTFTTPN